MPRIFFCLLLITSPSLAGDPQSQARKRLDPQPVVFPREVKTCDQALELLEKATGNRLPDLRQAKGKPVAFTADAKAATFWPALDLITRQARCGWSAFSDNLALVDTPRKPGPTAYAGIFRIGLRRVSLTRDFETGTTAHHLALEVAWEPRFQPFYLSVGPSEVLFQGQAAPVKLPAGSQVTVAGRGGIALDELMVAAPNNQALPLESFKSRLSVIGPSQMLDFRFENFGGNGKLPISLTQGDVKVTLALIERKADKWTVRMRIDNPPDGPFFESFQTWLSNNQIHFERNQGGKKELWKPDPLHQEEERVLKSDQAIVDYHFTGPRIKTQPAEWNLVYRSPGRIVELNVPFELNLRDK